MSRQEQIPRRKAATETLYVRLQTAEMATLYRALNRLREREQKPWLDKSDLVRDWLVKLEESERVVAS